MLSYYLCCSIKIIFNLGRLTWLVYLIGAAIGGRVTFNSNDDGDAMDGEMACKVLQLMTFSDARLPQGGYEKLEHSFLFFFEQFRKIYIGDQVRKINYMDHLKFHCCSHII